MRRIPLRRRDGTIKAYALVDDADYERPEIGGKRWHRGAGSCPYARRFETVDGRQVTIYLHREVLGLEPGDGREGDHEDGNTLDCRRSNLRAVSRATNQQNRHRANSTNRLGMLGVSPNRARFRAKLVRDGVKYELGIHATPGLAAAAVRAFRLERGELEAAPA